MKRCFKKFSLGNLLLKVNFIILIGATINFTTYVLNYLEFTKGFRIACIWFFTSLILELGLYSIKHS